MIVREARRRQHLRWLVVVVVLVLIAGAIAAVVGLSGGRPSARGPSRHAARLHTTAPSKATVPSTVPERPGSLAIGPNGNLYIADDLRSEVLERLSDGTFESVAGNGSSGFSGDGGLATIAQLNNPAGIAFGPDGTLYIADSGNGRIRAVSPAGIITTIAGSGAQLGWVPDGTPALDATLNPTAVAFGPGGLMFVTTDQEVLRLETNGTFVRVLGEDANEFAGLYGIGGPAVDASADGASGLAFDSAGNLYVFGFNTKAILMVDPHGTVRYLGSLYPRGPSGLVTGPDGAALAMDELGVVRLSPQGFETLLRFPSYDKVPYLGIRGFSPNGIAVAASGSIYLDTFYGNGYTDKSAIIMIGGYGSGSPSMLWQQHSS